MINGWLNALGRNANAHCHAFFLRPCVPSCFLVSLRLQLIPPLDNAGAEQAYFATLLQRH